MLSVVFHPITMLAWVCDSPAQAEYLVIPKDNLSPSITDIDKGNHLLIKALLLLESFSFVRHFEPAIKLLFCRQ